MNKKQVFAILGAFFILVLIITNPSEETHIEKVKSKLKIALKKSMAKELENKNSNVFESIGNGIGFLLADTMIDKMTDGFVTRKNYLLFSATNVEYKGENKIIGIGFLGSIYLSDKIDELFEKPQSKQDTNDNVVESPIFEKKNVERDISNINMSNFSRLDSLLIQQINLPETATPSLQCSNENYFCNVAYEWSNFYDEIPDTYKKNVITAENDKYPMDMNDFYGLNKGFYWSSKYENLSKVGEEIQNIGFDNENVSFKAGMVYFYVRYALLKEKD